MATKYKPVFLGIAAIATVIGVLGLLDIPNVPYAGYFGGPDNDVVRVFPESPAERAGLQVGDVIESIGGIAVTEQISDNASVGEISAGGDHRRVDVIDLGKPFLKSRIQGDFS